MEKMNSLEGKLLTERKNTDDLKTFIGRYVEAVQVYDDKLKINLIVFLIQINGLSFIN